MKRKKRHNRLLKSKDILNYIYEGKSILTLEAPSGKSYTYYFKLPVYPEDFEDDVRFAYTDGPDNKQIYVGMLEDGHFRVTMGSRYEEDHEVAKGADYIVKMAYNQELVDTTPMKLFGFRFNNARI